MSRFLPHPLLTLLLTATWLLLVNKITLGNAILGFGMGLVLPVITRPFWADRPVLTKPLKILEYILIVLWDIVVANVVVAWIILTKSNANTRSVWVNVPLELTEPEAITVLAGTITMTPGTVSACLSADAAHILVHTLHTDDPDGVRDDIKRRYERRLKEIFE